MTYKVLGFTSEYTHIVFEKEGDNVTISAMLPKMQLIGKLNIDPREIDRAFKNELLNEARKGGVVYPVFSKDNVYWQRSIYFGKVKYKNIYYDYCKYVTEKDYKEYPETIEKE